MDQQPAEQDRRRRLPGTERVSSGTSDGPTMALLALSAATTPSLSPVPYFALFREKRRD